MARVPQPRRAHRQRLTPLDPLCLLVAGVVRATLPAPEFTLAWRHSVEKTRWEEHYRVQGDELLLAEARVEGTGAGMEPPPEAVFRGGWWTWQPRRTVADLMLARSSATSDYVLCWRDRCSDLGAIIGSAPDNSPVTIAACASTTAAPSR